MGKTFGLITVDWEQRVDIDRLRRERLARIKGLLAESDVGALLCFDMSNIRYITATHIGTWAMDKLARFCLLPQNDDPVVWDFGSAARHHEIYCPWLEGRSPAGISTMRGAMSPESGRAEDVAAKIRRSLEERGLLGARVALVLDGPGQGEQRSFARTWGTRSGCWRRRPANTERSISPVRAVAWLMAACRLIPAARRDRQAALLFVRRPTSISSRCLDKPMNDV